MGGRDRGRDLWNLGLLGAKARDPDRAVKPPPGPGRHEFDTREEPGEERDKDKGPRRLAVDLLFPKGPAERAGLRLGDVITGVGEADFGEAGSLGPLAEALLAAESGTGKGVVRLRVQRAGKGAPEVLPVTVPALGPDAARPHEGKGRDAILRAALAWLADRQTGDGGFPETLSSGNGVVVKSALAGLAWLGAGSDLRRGKHAKSVGQSVDLLLRRTGKDDLPSGAKGIPGVDGSMDQTNWAYAHACVFLGELEKRSPSPKVHRLLLEFASTLAARQEKSGGWAHGPGGKNPLGYCELNIMTGLALWGLGAARSGGGWKPPADTLKRAEEYLRASADVRGGVGYSSDAGQRGDPNIGRTAAAWLGFEALGCGDEAWCRTLRSWVDGHAGEVLKGHASLMQHFLLAGVAANTLGGEARKRYWDVARRDLVLARAPDGSLQPRPWHESLAMGTNVDVDYGEVWTTAAWAVVLACEPAKERPGLPVVCPKPRPLPAVSGGDPPPADPDPPPPPPPGDDPPQPK